MRRRGWRTAMPSLILGTLLLTGCNPAQVESVVVQCGHLAGMTKAQQAQAAAELRKLPPDSVIGNAIVPDWLRMRDEARACAQKAIGK